MGKRALSQIAIAVVWIAGTCAFENYRAVAQEKPVTVRVNIENESSKRAEKAAGAPQDASEVVVWLKPVDPADNQTAAAAVPGEKTTGDSKEQEFSPTFDCGSCGISGGFPEPRSIFSQRVFVV